MKKYLLLLCLLPTIAQAAMLVREWDEGNGYYTCWYSDGSVARHFGFCHLTN